MTPEQEILMKIQTGQSVSQEDVEILDCAYQFYDDSFKVLKEINLTELETEEIPELENFLHNVFNLELIFQIPIHVGLVFRMTTIADYNSENGKVRESNFLSLTPLKIIRKFGWYGRANTSNSTCLYLAENAQVAVFECKPRAGDRIIITGWASKERKPLIMYPINSAERINIGVDKATNALDRKLYDSNQYFTRMIKKIQKFIGSEFVKDIPVISENKYEYFFSAYFADKVMSKTITFIDENNKPVLGQYDGIIYPNIATDYNYDNIAIRESSVEKLVPKFCHEYLVERTDYENFDGTSEQLPFQGKLIRKSKSISDRIVWDDD